MEKEKIFTKDFCLILASTFFSAMVMYMLMTTITEYVASFGATASLAGLVSGIYVIGGLISRLYSGSGQARFGWKKIALAFLSVHFIACCCYFLTESMTSLLVIRFLHGFGFGAGSNAVLTVGTYSLPKSRYPVFYLMHGGWSDETVYLGTPDNPRWMKHILDHGIANGEISPVIVVCPTYNNTSNEDSGNYGLALQLTDNYHNELVNDLIPAVDSTYSTLPDREHRAFCGFSMGSMTTWRTFQYCLEQFRYFMPSSGGPAMSAQDYSKIIETSGYNWDDFFIFAASGTNDFAYSGFKRGIEALKNTSPFRYANNEAEGNLYYLESDGDHSGTYAMLYFYNGLRWLWK